jgi:hypothetical protein
VAPVVVVRRSGRPGCIRSIGAVRSSAWTWDFASTHSTIAFCGGAMYRPTTSVTFPTSSGVGGELERLDPPRLHP